MHGARSQYSLAVVRLILHIRRTTARGYYVQAPWTERTDDTPDAADSETKKSTSAPARSRTMGTGLMKSPTPASYGDVPPLSPPVDWIIPNEDAGVVWLHTSLLQYPFII